MQEYKNYRSHCTDDHVLKNAIVNLKQPNVITVKKTTVPLQTSV